MKRISLFLFLAVLLVDVSSQTYSNKKVGNSKVEMDSLAIVDYPYLLPIMAEKVTQLGFDIPYSAGLSVQYVWQESDMVINNLSVGFNNSQMFALDEIVRFNNATATTSGVNFRPDVWVFPFLNVYGIFARSHNATSVDFGLYAPGNFSISDGTLDWEWTSVMEAKTKANFEATSFGIGMTPTIGVAGGFLALDMNFTWTDIPELDKPTHIFIFGPRLGKTFQFKKPESNIALWVGGFRVRMKSETSGSLLATDLMPDYYEKINNGIDKVDQAYQVVEDKWESLPWQDKLKPQNILKYEAAKKSLDLAGGALDAASRAESVQYDLNKRPKMMWNFIVGSQYQYNKHLMLRAEAGFLAARTQMILGLQYRFGL